MGYMSLDSWGDSDMAADAYYRVIKAMVKELNSSMELKENNYNTSGGVNVALIIESGILDKVPAHMLDDLNTKLLLKLLEAEINSAMPDRKDDWGNEDNRKKHLKDYKRLYAVVWTLYQRIQGR
jgi:hypothetical protein